MSHQLFLFLTGALTTISISFMGILVYFKNRKGKINRIFVLLCASIAAWSLPYMFFPYAESHQKALLIYRLLVIGPLFLGPLFLHFCSHLLDVYKKTKKVIITGYIFALFLIPVVFTNLYIKDVVIKFQSIYWGVARPVWYIWSLSLGLYFFYSFYLLFKHLKITSGIKKLQIKYILFGMILSFAGGTSNMLPFFNIDIFPYANILSIVYPLFIAYAIITQRLMDIKLMMRKSMVYILSVATILIPATIINFSLNIYPTYVIWLNLLVLISAVSLFTPIKNYYYRFANKYLFTSLYDSREIIANLNNELRKTLELDKIYDAISNALINSLHSKAVKIFLYDEETKNYNIQHTKGFDTGQRKTFPSNKYIHQEYAKQKRPIIFEELKAQTTNKPEYRSIIKLLEARKVAMIIPLVIQDKALGIITLIGKESGDIYNQEDLKLLNVVSTQSAFAINNALLYQKTKDFSVKLEEEKNKTLDLITNFVDGILVFDPANKLFLVNSKAEEFLKIKARKLIGRSLSELAKLSNLEHLIKLLENNENQLFRKELAIEKNLILEVSTVRKTGKSQLLVILRNITREKLIDQMKSEFITIAAHQMRTPLSSVKWALKMILDKEAGPLLVKQRELLKKGYQANEDMIHLVNDLLNIDRIEEGGLKFNIKKHNINKFIKTVVLTFKKKAEEKNINLQTKLGKISSMAPFDQDKLKMALWNLIDNAITYTKRGGEVMILTKQKDDSVEISIKDTGVGIPKHQTNRIFTKFFRGDYAVKIQTEGTGIGLYLVKKIIEKHRGKIRFESEENKGTTFYIDLPLLPN